MDAIGVDFEPSGNEGRLLFAWPVVRRADGSTTVVRGSEAEPGRPRPEIAEAELAELVELLPEALTVRPAEGLLVIGPEWIENASRMDDLWMDSMVKLISARGTELTSGFFVAPMPQAVYVEFAHTLGARAMLVFDEAIKECSAARIGRRAEAAFRIISAEPEIPYEARVIRRLLYFRIKGDHERLRSVLDTASARLGMTGDELADVVVDAYEVLREAVPFEGARAERRRTRGAAAFVEQAAIEAAFDELLIEPRDLVAPSSNVVADPREASEEEDSQDLLRAFRALTWPTEKG